MTTVDRVKEQKDVMKEAREKIIELGYEITGETVRFITFDYLGEVVMVFPFSEWYTGKSVTGGKGLNKLFKEIKNK